MMIFKRYFFAIIACILTLPLACSREQESAYTEQGSHWRSTRALSNPAREVLLYAFDRKTSCHLISPDYFKASEGDLKGMSALRWR